ncbi:MAG: FAD:protein FMN transferase [Treponema sp.]|nr:FAD:protein FMN transferase [Treponema sp.]
MIRKFFVRTLFSVLVLTVLAGCQKAEPSQSEFVLATLCTVTLYDKGNDKVYRDVFDRLTEIENRMSVHIETSDIYLINQSAGIEPVKVHDDVYKVIETAVHYSDLSDGAFDITVEPLVSLWDIGGDNPRVPSPAEIDSVLPLINWHDIVLDPVNKTVFLKNREQALDLGAIAKGYAADEAAAIIKKAGIPRAIIDLGGNIMIVGTKKDKSLWKIGIQNPNDSRGEYIGIAQMTAKTVVTSGVYERYFFSDGIRYHHLLSVATGYPADNGLLSVTIITNNSIDADALSTSVFVLGYEKGRALVESLDGVDAVFIFDDSTIRMTGGVNFNLTNDQFRIINN